MSNKRKRKRKALLVDGTSKAHSVFISHSDEDYQQAIAEVLTNDFYGGSFAKATELGKPDGAIDALFVDETGVHVMELKATTKLHRKISTDLPTKTCSSSFGLPTAAEFVLILMSRARRNDVLNDIMDWYPAWVAEGGRFGACLACWWRIGLAVFGGLLDLLQRIGEIVTKFRGAR